MPLDFSPEDYIDTESPVPPDPEQPDCTKILELPYSIHAFQHLRKNALKFREQHVESQCKFIAVYNIAGDYTNKIIPKIGRAHV